MPVHPAFARGAPLLASLVLHAALVAGAAEFGRFLTPRPPEVLEALLVAPDPPPVREPPRPEPPRPKPPRLVVPPKPVVPPPREVTSEPPPTPAARREPVEPAAEPPPVSIASAAPALTTPEPRAPAGPPPRPAPAPVSPGVEAVPSPAPKTHPPAAPPATTRTVPDGPSQLARPRGGYQVTPSYPSSARRLGIQGTALLRVYVAADGQVTDIQVDETAGHPDLDRAAVDAVRRWRFEPGRRGADAIGMWVRLPVQFVLR